MSLISRNPNGMAPKTLQRVLLPLIILGVGVAGFVLLVASKPKSQAAPRAESVWTVSVLEAELRSVRPTLTLYGRVETPRRSRLKAAIEAEVREVPVKEGEKTRGDQTLVRLDDRETAALVAQREADVRDAEASIASEESRYQNDLNALVREQELLKLAQAEAKRAFDLVQKSLGSESQRDTAQQNLVRQRLAVESREQSIVDHANRRTQFAARLARAKAQLEIAKLDHQRTRISAPFAGRIARVAVSAGDRVRPGDTIVELYDTVGLETRAQIPDTYLGVVRRSLDRGETLPAVSRVDGRAIELRLDRLAAEVTKGSGGVDALFRIRESVDWLAIGRFITLQLTLPPQSNILALPREALYGRNQIYRVIEGRLDPLLIERVGSRVTDGGTEEILVTRPEIKAGDHIVTTQLPNAIEGLRVSVPATASRTESAQ